MDKVERIDRASLPPLPERPINLFPVWLSAIVALMIVIVRDLDLSFETLLYGAQDMAEYFSRYTEITPAIHETIRTYVHSYSQRGRFTQLYTTCQGFMLWQVASRASC